MHKGIIGISSLDISSIRFSRWNIFFRWRVFIDATVKSTVLTIENNLLLCCTVLTVAYPIDNILVMQKVLRALESQLETGKHWLMRHWKLWTWKRLRRHLWEYETYAISTSSQRLKLVTSVSTCNNSESFVRCLTFHMHWIHLLVCVCSCALPQFWNFNNLGLQRDLQHLKERKFVQTSFA
jgi:hypothetical protein